MKNTRRRMIARLRIEDRETGRVFFCYTPSTRSESLPAESPRWRISGGGAYDTASNVIVGGEPVTSRDLWDDHETVMQPLPLEPHHVS